MRSGRRSSWRTGFGGSRRSGSTPGVGFTGHQREYTWYSSHSQGYRLDHAFVTPSLVDRLERAEYSHIEREEGVSDHAPLIVEVTEV